jgi:hypothetical protein
MNLGSHRCAAVGPQFDGACPGASFGDAYNVGFFFSKLPSAGELGESVE